MTTNPSAAASERTQRVERLNFWLIVITTLTILAYVAFCFWLA